ncbi:hypothetical protein HJC23_004927 [Cyclotella cryptica]|uniref:Nitrogen permease regulator 3 n=1 Tax=Cyclotella cryptica TaxID=29204 RepID=A0ABD3PS38_9STRA|eukprot:CCRYP_011891-RA/>CCRYP_011891-RA protein AED:0.22 eAED:0.22 QI:172/1/1/1/1/1/3/3273/696
MDAHEDTTGRMGVLGIGLVMEEVGKGARLVFRYPASPPPYFMGCKTRRTANASGESAQRPTPRSSKAQQKDDPSVGSNGASGSIDLFFDLPARVISKLFRPKRPLCGQPLTLNVSGTTFCCRAELFDNAQSCPSTVGGDGSERPLVLFSVIVALAPLVTSHQSSSSKSSTRFHHHDTSHLADSSSTSDKSNNNSPHRRIDSTFTTIERIHCNLARLCKVLTREEMRCQYVTLQCQKLLSVRKDYEDNLLPVSRGNSANSIAEANHSNPATQDDSGSNNTRRISNSSVSNAGGSQILSKDKRTLGQTTSGSGNTTEAKGAPGTYSPDNNQDRKGMSPHEKRESIQQLIEMMFASSPPVSNHGNLARELAAVFHFLAKHDDPASPSTASVILSRASGRDGVIYINRHVAVSLDSIDAKPTTVDRNGQSKLPDNEPHVDVVNPYETLLFPNSSPPEILLGIENVTFPCSVGSSTSTTDISASVSISHAIRRMLAQLHPGKSLQEVALDSALSLNHVLEAAKWLVHAGICLTAMPVTRNSRYVCVEGVVDKMKKLALPFWQAFHSKSRNRQFHFGNGDKKSDVTGVPHIFLIVSALTSNAEAPEKQQSHAAAAPRLGDVIHSLCGTHGHSLDSDSQYRWNVSKREKDSSKSNPFRFERPVSHENVGSAVQREDSSMEDVVYSMAVWLVSNSVICQVDGWQ